MILDQYPGVTREDVLACIAYGSEMSRERYVDFPAARLARGSSSTRTSVARGRRF
jgi:hypothetical protein